MSAGDEKGAQAMDGFGSICEIKKVTHAHRQGRTEEFYTRDGSVRTIYRFFFPDPRAQKHLAPEQQMVIVGLDDGFYQECEREPFQPQLHASLEQKFAASRIWETSNLQVGSTIIESTYYEDGREAAA